MASPNDKLRFRVTAQRLDAHGSAARTKRAQITLDTDLRGRTDAFNPAELLLAALAACIIKGIERVTPILKFQARGVTVNVRGTRQDTPPRMESIEYEISIDTDENDNRIELLHQNVQKFGTVFNTIAPGTELTGTIRRTARANDKSR